MRILLSSTGLPNSVVFIKTTESSVEFVFGIGVKEEHLALSFPMLSAAAAVDRSPKKRFGGLIETEAMLLMKPIVFDLNDISDQNRHKDFSYYASGYSIDTFEPNTIDNIFSETSRNKYSITQLSRQTGRVYNSFIITPSRKERLIENCILGVWAQNKESVITDIFPIIDAKSTDEVSGLPTITRYSKMKREIELIESPPGKRFPDIRNILPTFDIIGPEYIKPGDIQKYKIQAKDGMFSKEFLDDISVCIETNAGYLPKSETVLRSGAAEFKFRASDLESGDIAMIKVGIDNFTNIRRIPITVK